MSCRFAELGRPFSAGALLGLEHPPQPVLAGLFGVGTGDGPVVEELDVAVHPAEVALVAVVGLSSSFRSSRSGVIQTFSSSFLIMASIDRSLSTTVQTQQPNRLVPQLGVELSTTSGHSPPSVAPWYMPSSDLLSWPHGFFTCIR